VEQNISKIDDGNHPLADALRTPQTSDPIEPGRDLFVINLCSSIAPMALTGKQVAGLEHCRLYQVARMEDGRTRHRLRLGFFPSEAAAEQALSLVRDNYPTAFTTALSMEDRKFARGFAVDAAPAAAKPRPAMSLVANRPVPAATEARKDVAPPAAPVTVVILEPKPVTLELSLASDPDPVPQPVPSSTAAAPFHVGKGVDIPALSFDLDLSADPPEQAATPQVPPRGSVIAATSRERADVIPLSPVKPVATAKFQSPARLQPPGSSIPASKAAMASGPAHHTPRSPAPAIPPLPRPSLRPLPELDSTQTIRALTSAELNDDGGEKWFAIQLAVSEQAVNLETMPHLDIFEAYRLYSVASAGSGKILHSLRVGFFSEQVSAEAVAGYLKTFFAAPTALRISTAEYLRFCHSPTQKPKAGTANPAKVIELSPGRPTPAIPTVTEVATAVAPQAGGKSGATGSHKALQLAAKSAVAAKRAATPARFGTTGKFKAMPSKTLQQALLEEARASIQAQQEQNKPAKGDSLLSRLVGRLTK